MSFSSQYKRIIKNFRSTLQHVRRTYSRACIIIAHDLAPLYHPIHKTHRAPEKNEILSWVVKILLNSDRIYMFKRVNASHDQILIILAKMSV